MNNERPSEGRISWTISSLNHTLPLQESMRILVNSKESEANIHVSGTLSDSQKIEREIRKRLPKTEAKLVKKVKWQHTWWYEGNLPDGRWERPSERLNKGFSKVIYYTERYLSWIHRDFPVPEVADDNADDVVLDDDEILANL